MFARRSILPIALLAALPLAAWAQDDGFREFPDSEVASPTELIQVLLGVDISSLTPRPGPGIVPPSPGMSTPSKGANGSGRPSMPPGQRKGATPSPGGAPGGRPGGTPQPGGAPSPSPPGTPGGAPTLPQNIPPVPDVPDSPSERPRRSLSRPKALFDDRRVSQDPSRKEFRDRMNRILLDAAQRSAERQTDGDSASRGAMDRLLQKLTESAQDKLAANPRWQRKMSRRMRGVGNRLGNTSLQRMSWLQSDRVPSTPRVNWAGAGQGVVVALAFAGLAYAGWRWRRQRRRLQPLSPAARRKMLVEVSRVIASIKSREDLVRAVDQYLLCCRGPGAECWNGAVARQSLQQDYPQLAGEIQHLVADYQTARYAPGDRRLDPNQLQRCSTTLRQLVSADEPAADANEPTTGRLP